MQPQSQICLSLPPRETQGTRHLSQPIRKSLSHQEHPQESASRRSHYEAELT